MDQGIQCRARESGLVNYRSGHLVGTDCFRIARKNEAARVAAWRISNRSVCHILQHT